MITGPVLRVGKLRHRTVKQVAHAHTPVGGTAGTRTQVVRPQPVPLPPPPGQQWLSHPVGLSDTASKDLEDNEQGCMRE